MWSKRPKPGQKGTRCSIQVSRDGEMVNCDRPAKHYIYDQPAVAHWIEPLKPEAITVNCCIAHHRKLVNEGAQLTPIRILKRARA